MKEHYELLIRARFLLGTVNVWIPIFGRTATGKVVARVKELKTFGQEELFCSQVVGKVI